MAFQAYLDTIQQKTELDVDGLKAAATRQGCQSGAASKPAPRRARWYTGYKRSTA